jgi:hypothetical protein
MGRPTHASAQACVRVSATVPTTGDDDSDDLSGLFLSSSPSQATVPSLLLHLRWA